MFERIFKKKKEEKKEGSDLSSLFLQIDDSLILPENKIIDDKTAEYEKLGAISSKAEKRARIFLMGKKKIVILTIEIILILYFILAVLGIVPFF